MRTDTFFGANPALTTEKLINGLKCRDGKLTLKDIAAARTERSTNTKTINLEFFFGDTQVFLANGESGLLLRGLGGVSTEEISYASFYSIVVKELVPTSYQARVDANHARADPQQK